MMRLLITMCIFTSVAAAETKPAPTQAEQDEIWRKAMEESNRIRQQSATPAPSQSASVAAPTPDPVKSKDEFHFPWTAIGNGEFRITSWYIGKAHISDRRGFSTSADDVVVINLEVRNPDTAKILRYESWRTELFKIDERGTAGLTDDIGNAYRRQYLGIGKEWLGASTSLNVDIYPGKLTTDVLIFSKPVDAAKHLVLTLPASAMGGTNSTNITLRIEQ